MRWLRPKRLSLSLTHTHTQETEETAAPKNSNCRLSPTTIIKGSTMMGAAVAGLSPQLLSSSSCSSRLPSSRRILFNLQSQSPSCAAAYKAQATSSSPFTAPGSGLSVPSVSSRPVTVVARQPRQRVKAAELLPPPIDNDLHAIMGDMGAIFSEEGVVETFQNDKDALAAAESSVAVIEMSHFGRLRVTGEDRIRFLHNQSTADFQSLKEGQGCDTVFVTSTGRTIDLAMAWIMKNSVILLISPSTRQSLCTLLNKYIFFADKVEVEDITDKTYFFSLVGPKSNEVLDKLGLGGIIDKPYGSFMHYMVEGTPVTVGVGGGLAGLGYSFMLSTDTAGLVWEALLDAGAVPMGSKAWEQIRVWQGRPVPGSELTSEFNALEAGLWHTISMQKGCYIGQETIARLITYDGVKQQLWGVLMDGPADPETDVYVDGTKVGKLTSVVEAKEGSGYTHAGMVYIRRKAGGAGLTVDIGGVSGKVVDLQFITKGLPQ